MKIDDGNKMRKHIIRDWIWTLSCFKLNEEHSTIKFPRVLSDIVSLR